VLGREELIVRKDPSVVGDDQKFAPRGQDKLAVGRKHLPVKGHDIAEPTHVLGRAEPVAVISDILFVRSADPLFEGFVAPRFPSLDVVLAVWHPQRGNGDTSTLLISFVPYVDISIGQCLSVEHVFLSHLISQDLRSVPRPANFARALGEIHDLVGQKVTVSR
jgi:hypothetical protein